MKGVRQQWWAAASSGKRLLPTALALLLQLICPILTNGMTSLQLLCCSLRTEDLREAMALCCSENAKRDISVPGEEKTRGGLLSSFPS